MNFPTPTKDDIERQHRSTVTPLAEEYIAALRFVEGASRRGLGGAFADDDGALTVNIAAQLERADYLTLVILSGSAGYELTEGGRDALAEVDPQCVLEALAKRALAAADVRGIPTHDLQLAAEHLEIDSGGWRGELLSVVIAAWGDRLLYVPPHLSGWSVFATDGTILGQGATEAEALIAALEAAP